MPTSATVGEYNARKMKKLYIETYGCQMNVADSEVVASVMQMAGYELCDSAEEADAVFLNTCSRARLRRIRYITALKHSTNDQTTKRPNDQTTKRPNDQ